MVTNSGALRDSKYEGELQNCDIPYCVVVPYICITISKFWENKKDGPTVTWKYWAVFHMQVTSGKLTCQSSGVSPFKTQQYTLQVFSPGLCTSQHTIHRCANASAILSRDVFTIPNSWNCYHFVLSHATSHSRCRHSTKFAVHFPHLYTSSRPYVQTCVSSVDLGEQMPCHSVGICMVFLLYVFAYDASACSPHGMLLNRLYIGTPSLLCA